VSQAPSGGWTHYQEAGPIVIPAHARIISIKATWGWPKSGVTLPGILAESTDNSITSDGSVWKCNTQIDNLTTWMLSRNDDSLWPQCNNDAPNIPTVSPRYHKYFPDISDGIYWIWNGLGVSTDADIAYFRMTVHNKCT